MSWACLYDDGVCMDGIKIQIGSKLSSGGAKSGVMGDVQIGSVRSERVRVNSQLGC